MSDLIFAQPDATVPGIRTAQDWTRRGVALHAQGNLEEAVRHHRIAIEINPLSAVAYSNLGRALSHLYRYDEAVDAYSDAVAIKPQHMGFVANLADGLTKAGRCTEAIARLRRALEASPLDLDLHVNMATAHWAFGDLPSAERYLRNAIAIDPACALAHRNLGMLLLQLGRFGEAWPEYDWRWKVARKRRGEPPVPVWQGEPLHGELLVVGEQGLGDEILHLGMLDDLLARGLRVGWACDARLWPFLERRYPTVRRLSRFDHKPFLTPDVRACVDAGALGGFVRNQASAFKPDRLSYLVADPARVAQMCELVKPAGCVVGVSWASLGAQFGPLKSTRLRDWTPVLRTPGSTFLDLQYGDTEAERAEMRNPIGHLDGLDCGADLEGLAAAIGICDLVITVSNTTAHFAAALGVPTWVLLSADTGKLWYWGAGDTTPWYPTVRVFRQSRGEPWSDVLARVAAELAA